MNSLLKRQIRKFLSDDLKESKDLKKFLTAIDLSYNNFDEQSVMIQRAMKISSDELFDANKKLRLEAKEQKELIDKLKVVINTLKFYNLEDDEKSKAVELTGSDLVDFIDNQTKEIIEINKQKESLLNELAYQNQELSDYAHMVSHDLKSPLRSIDTLTTWLKDDYEDQIDEAGKKQINAIRDSVEKMDTLINGILEYSTIGKNSIEAYPVELNVLLNDILDLIEIPKHVFVKVNKLPVIQGDKYRLQQLFQNLISNAVSYNDKNEGVVEVGVTDRGNKWEFFVKDNGKGISEVYYEKIFKAFEKLENNVNSTGIGLSIVKKIVDLYGGKIWLESQLGIGTTFYFTIKK